MPWASLALYGCAIKKMCSKSAKGLTPGKVQNPKSPLLCRGLPMAFMYLPLKNCAVNPQKIQNCMSETRKVTPQRESNNNSV